MHALHCFDGLVIGPSVENYHNGSKAFQMTTSIKEAIVENNLTNVSFPNSFFIKGMKQFEKIQELDLIVKSCSGIRSKVTTKEDFGLWDLNNLDHLPVLFQEAVRGNDIRIHCLGSEKFAVILHEKGIGIDYRYAKKRGYFEKMTEIKDLEKFCTSITEIENLQLAGIDFIKSGNTYYCLECNPSPGWAGFHRHSGDENLLSQSLIRKLELSKL
jgi:predicted ATP-grasp superfamily ATP-dependent carboligase